MGDFREFENDTLDDAIRAACEYFDSTRERLEIELVQDAKHGVFGLVGARKALIRARLAQAESAVKKLRKRGSEKKPSGHSKKNREMREPQGVAVEKNPKTFGGKGNKKEASSLEVEEAVEVLADSKQPEDMFLVPLTDLDQDKLIHETEQMVERLVTPIIGEITIGVEVFDNRIDVHIDCGEYSGLIIGREGQTLAALQYLSSRIISRIMDCHIRVQFDVGDYRERQDERLHELALFLAERAKTSGHACSTRPMSSYHRRIIHLTLQDDEAIQTRSVGGGASKRVIIQCRRQPR